jgi:hypothetical protein
MKVKSLNSYKVTSAVRRFAFLIGIACVAAIDTVFGRKLAINAVLLPHETSRGTQSMDGTAAITFKNAVVVRGADDRHFKLAAAATDIPLGILLNDELATDEVDVVPKNIALFGVYHETLPAVAAAAIAVGAEVVPDLATPGRVKTIPTSGGGTAVVIGRSRFTVAGAGDPVSIVHCVPRTVTIA